MQRRRVVLTGASGNLAGRMLPVLRERYELTLLDARATNRQGEEVEGITVTDLTDRNRDRYREYFRGKDAVVHCAYVRVARRQENVEGHFSAEMDNITMAYNLYQTCIEEGVRRVVVFSSNHAADYYERLIWAGKGAGIDPDVRPLSDNIYGWAKSAYEHLGFVFACGGVGKKKLENVQLRIGATWQRVLDRCDPTNLKEVHRALGAFLSARDQTQLVIKSIEADRIGDENGVPFQIFYGISGNTHAFWSIANARKIIGYSPQDNSEVLFADTLAGIIENAQRRSGK